MTVFKKNKGLFYKIQILCQIFFVICIWNVEEVKSSNQMACAIDMDISTRLYDSQISLKDIETSISKKPENEIIIAVIAQNVSNLDTYQVEIIFDNKKIHFIGGYEDNPFDNITNILKNNGGTTVGFQAVVNSPGVINIANALSGSDETIAPEGTGVLALLKFKILTNDQNIQLLLSNVNYIDSFNVDFEINNLTHAIINPFKKDTIKDISGNGKIDLIDAIIILKKISEINQ